MINNINIKGFTLVETLVAISILMIAIVGPMTIAQNGLSSSIYAREQFIAQFLAQDALEYVRNVRDNNTNLSYGKIPNLGLMG